MTEGETTRRFRITIDPPQGTAIAVASAGARAGEPGGDNFDGATPVFSPFAGKAELVDVVVRVGDEVRSGQVVAAVEVMKARHEVRAPADGRVLRIDAALGTDVTSAAPIMLLVAQ